jgi:hypothetical protein
MSRKEEKRQERAYNELIKMHDKNTKARMNMKMTDPRLDQSFLDEARMVRDYMEKYNLTF